MALSCTTAPFGAESLIGGLIGRSLLISSVRLRQDEVKGRITKIAERLELFIASWNQGFSKTGGIPVAPVVGTSYATVTDWTTWAITIE